MQIKEKVQTSIVDCADSNDVLINVKFEPIMQVAIDTLELFTKDKRIILKAVGNAIPNAVAIANILTESMLKNDASIKDITVDSEAPPGIGRMTSIIKIVLVRS